MESEAPLGSAFKRVIFISRSPVPPPPARPVKHSQLRSPLPPPPPPSSPPPPPPPLARGRHSARALRGRAHGHLPRRAATAVHRATTSSGAGRGPHAAPRRLLCSVSRRPATSRSPRVNYAARDPRRLRTGSVR